jgi:photosystem II stability/assembly factor-like uncharacterized protein
MRRILGVILMAVLGVVSGAAAQWKNSCWVSGSDASERGLWLLCQEDSLLVSTDRGLSWQTRPLPSGVRFRTVDFLTNDKGFLAGDGGILLGTEDGGSSWRNVQPPTDQNLLSMSFVGDKGWVSGYGGVILHSGDGGKTWVKQQSSTQQPLESIYFADAENGWAVGWVGTLVRTTDGGQNWKPVDVPDASWTLSSVYFRDKDNGWTAGFQGSILRTRDGGLTWKAQESPVTSWLTSVRFDRQGRGWIAADSELLVSEDGGETWRGIPVEDRIFVSSILPAGDTLWAVGRLGLLEQPNPLEATLRTVLVPGIGYWPEASEPAGAMIAPPTGGSTSRGRP